MSDDIVTRLRTLNNSTEHNPKDWFCIWEAADEIERLRKEVARLTLVSSLWESEFVAAADELKRFGK